MHENLIIHIGFPKTGTTTLQNNFFSKNIEMICFPGDDKEILEKFMHVLTDRENIEYKNEYDDFHAYVKNLFSDSQEKTYVISHESFCIGSSHAGQVDRYVIAKRLSELFPSAKIMVVIRNQIEIIKSYYLQMVRHGSLPSVDFKEWLSEEFKNLNLTSVYHFFNYCSIVDIYSELFGESKVGIFVYEEFKKDHEKFLKSVCRFMNIDTLNALSIYESKIENTRLTYIEHYAYSLFKKYKSLKLIADAMPKKHKSIAKYFLKLGQPMDVDYTDYDKDKIFNFYKESNEKLSNRYDLNLRSYGYY